MYRPQPQRNLRLLVWLWVAWITLVLCGYLLWAVYKESQEEGGVSWFLRRLLEPEEALAVALMVAPVGILLGSVHYTVLRCLPASDKGECSFSEIVVVGPLAVVLAVIPAYVTYESWRHEQLVESAFQEDLEHELAALMKHGDMKAVVRRMEMGCESFRRTRAELGENHYFLGSGGHGFSYLYVNLHEQWGCIEGSASNGMLQFLQAVKYDGHSGGSNEIGEYGAWRPLAEEMSRSDTPIIKILGCYLLEDNEAFATAVYAAVYAGDDHLGPLAVFAATNCDPDEARAKSWIWLGKRTSLGL